jgi:hypothetical protein
VAKPGGAERFAEHLARLLGDGDGLALLVGSGLSGAVLPRIAGLLDLADEYAQNRADGGDLTAALQRARATHDDVVQIYVAYRREFAAWVSGTEFDVVVQEAVLQAYRPADGAPIPNHGRWQRVDEALGERLERDLVSWELPHGTAALGYLLANKPDLFYSRVLTTNFDPLLEIAIRRAGHDATTLTFHPDGANDVHGPPDDSIRVYHLHGFWRPSGNGHRRLLHDVPSPAERRSPALLDWVRRLIWADTVCVIGYSGWDGLFLDALREVTRTGRTPRVLWAAHTADDAARTRLAGWLRERTGCTVEVFGGVDSDTALPVVATSLGLMPARTAPTRHRVRHLGWERELISEQGIAPPDDCLDLLRQLDRRFQWGRSWAADKRPEPPELLFWPVRLRASKPSVIHMAQALAAAAISARRVHVIACLDDYGTADLPDSRERFERAVRRWFRQVPDSVEPEVVSLREEIERTEIRGTGTDGMVRPTHPWDVAREVYGERNPSLLSVLVASKVVPDVPTDRLMDHAPVILRALASQSARRLLTPLTLWSYLHRLLPRWPAARVITLGGREESSFWELWHSSFDHPINQLYNPYIKSLTNESLMVRWSTPDELRSYLDQRLAAGDGEEEGQYFHWLIQNAFLLPSYLAGQPLPVVHGVRLDSWPSILASVKADPSTLDLVVERVCATYLGLGDE